MTAYLGRSFGPNLKEEKEFIIVIALMKQEDVRAPSLRTFSSGEISADVAAESEDIAEGGLAWAERSERDVEVLMRENMTEGMRNHSRGLLLGSESDI